VIAAPDSATMAGMIDARTKSQTVARLRTVQKNIAQQDARLAERNALMVELHQVHRVRQIDISEIVNDASKSAGGAGLSESGVGAAITRTLGHRAGRVANLAGRPSS
jgi:hypothetical protein